MRNRFSAADRVAGAIFALLIIIGVTACVATKPASDVTPAGSATPTSTAASSHAAAAAKTGAPPTTARAAVPPPTHATTPAAAKPKAPPKAAPPTVQAAAPAPPPEQPPTTAPPPQPKAGCYPVSDENTCYEPGEYCRDSDHGKSGVAGDGKAIVCEDHDGWRWEPA